MAAVSVRFLLIKCTAKSSNIAEIFRSRLLHSLTRLELDQSCPFTARVNHGCRVENERPSRRA